MTEYVTNKPRFAQDSVILSTLEFEIQTDA